MDTLSRGIVQVVLNNTNPTNGATFTYAVPSEKSLGAHYITWQTIPSSGAFDALSNSLALSLDGTNFTIVDTGTAAAGEVRTYGPTSAPFIRIVTTSHTNHTGVSDKLTILVTV